MIASPATLCPIKCVCLSGVPITERKWATHSSTVGCSVCGIWGATASYPRFCSSSAVQPIQSEVGEPSHPCMTNTRFMRSLYQMKRGGLERPASVVSVALSARLAMLDDVHGDVAPLHEFDQASHTAAAHLIRPH